MTVAKDVPAWVSTVAQVQANLGYCLLALLLAVFVIKTGYRWAIVLQHCSMQEYPSIMMGIGQTSFRIYHVVAIGTKSPNILAHGFLACGPERHSGSKEHSNAIGQALTKVSLPKSWRAKCLFAPGPA